MRRKVFVRCDECGERFPAHPQERGTEDGGLHMSMTCPECGRDYPIADITAKGVRLRARIRKRRDAGESDTGRPLKRLLARYKQEITRP